ncbi:FprA family A-type flavoprotein [Petrotoga sp. 9PWA.NaAc.5.4]|uniref:FprA family A-type flavoprotein n=1 Tax=Petrotoga sp. 9PWA.NaAc.5.4 TaxID=1434328 RepID=UPI000CBFBA43|nr:FprA family A-type flavoprotein [Petrotoga sp. 9PWA.NaAc.5.4]PNR93382.1 flavodoxin [Petrotoga sp. 9PWA.NaAc.5.4]
MNGTIKISDKVYYVGVNDRDTYLFESLWPLEKGVSYNSYLILDEKTALIDTVKETKMSEFFNKIRSLLNGKSLDYLIINHMEPDHSGSIPELLHEFPNIKIIGNKTTFQFLENLYKIHDNFQEIKDEDVLDLGQHKLKFYLTPMVHWPETMMTYDQTDKILFAGDAFGGFGTLDGGIFDDEVKIDFFEDEIRRYFSNIIAKYCPMVQKALNKLRDANIEIKIISSTHGPVWRKDPNRIITLYDKWSKYETEKGVVIAYGSMYGNTEEMADYIARKLAEEGIKEIKVMDVSKTHISHIINEIWRYKGLILGSCTYNQGLFPYMESLVQWLAHNNIKNHVLGIFGTYGWSGGGVSTLVKYNEQMKWPLVYQPVEARLSAKIEDFKKLDELAKAMAKEINS